MQKLIISQILNPIHLTIGNFSLAMENRQESQSSSLVHTCTLSALRKSLAKKMSQIKKCLVHKGIADHGCGFKVENISTFPIVRPHHYSCADLR